MRPDDPRELLERALVITGCSLRSFAESHMVRDERTVRRWRSGKSPIPEVAQVRLRQIIRMDDEEFRMSGQ